jgi:ribonuclease-3|tara:strand:- start:2883 stop:3686 length:804 start_codon:yes stop_codon:yes gene_type:complete
MDTTNKFKANPYNLNNRLLTINDITNIMKKLNINDFSTTNLKSYQKSFTHKSYCKLRDYDEYKYPGDNYLPLQNDSYETIEFLGDSILGSVVSSYIYRRFHLIYGETEGFLTKLKIRLVCGENLADVSEKMKLSEYLIISKHIEENCSGRGNKNILEDVLEALIGTLYIDKGYEYTEKFIIAVIETYCDFTEIILKDTNYKDQISRYFQQTFSLYPKYKTEKYDAVFRSSIFNGETLIKVGTGDTKKKAEQDVSKKALIHFNVITAF